MLIRAFEVTFLKVWTALDLTREKSATQRAVRQSEEETMVERGGAYEYATTAIPSSLQVAITKPKNVDKLPAGQAASMLTVFGLLLI
jgi:hypothetical protein